MRRPASMMSISCASRCNLTRMLGIGPDDIRLRELMQRLQKDDIKEVIIATNSSLEG